MARDFLGVDVSKEKLDVCLLPGGEVWSFANDPNGHAQLIAWAHSLREALVVVEATGGYERPAMFALQDAGLAVALVNPRQVRDFAKGICQLAKTDALDAAVLAEFARLVNPSPSEPTSERQRELDALVTRRRQLLETRVAEQNRVGQTTDRFIQKTLGKVLRTVDGQVKAIEERIAARGKPFKAIQIACVCKLLVILNTMLKNNTPWKNQIQNT